MSDVKLTNEVISPKDKRDNLVERVEVLEIVKQLLLLPGENMSTLKQVAEFYGVKDTAITNLITGHRGELESDGYVVLSGNDLVSSLKDATKIEKRGAYTVTMRTGEEYIFSSNKNGLFSKKAILRIGMLLRDSEVAKEVRAQLLNTEENAAKLVATKLSALGDTFDNSELESKQDRSHSLEGNFYSSITKSYVNGLVLCGLSLNLLLIKLSSISSK
ncbi:MULTISPECIES: hypothetical protein [Bacillus cereus group]|uniref:hypothetical protein n=1 Tax=Bacillus cereus group TaxID=86661 RepID=UPI0015D4FF40|nr:MULTISPECIES: hypothetical protein [Bacillus cereus group]MED3089248.1 hypothetical protein [Bacillus toyonensis]